MTNERVWVLHENPAWFPTLADGFAAEGVPLGEVSLIDGSIDLGSEPAPGIYWSRLSASAHTRGHDDAREYTRALTTWLEAHGRRVVNGRSVVELEVSKVAQYTALGAAGIAVPRTTAVFGDGGVRDAVASFDSPVIVKPNAGGKGLGVRRYDTLAEFDAAVAEAGGSIPFTADSADGITLVQEYVRPADGRITRAEFVGGRFLYAVTVDVTSGSFELCPADACVIDQAGRSIPVEFERRNGFEAHAIVPAYEAFLAATEIEIAGIEFIETADGRLVTYDVNTNTNYNPAVEAEAPIAGAVAVARFLGGLLEQSRD